MSEFIITFGFGHHDEKNGSLANCCTRIEANSEAEAKAAIRNVRANKWCHSYEKEEGEKMIQRYSVHEIPFTEIGPQIGESI